MTATIRDFEITAEGFYEVPASAVSSLGPGVQLIDVREASEFHGDLGHLDGARLVPLTTLRQAAENWDPYRPHLVICRSGRRSREGARLLRQLGFHEVGNLTGGMTAIRQL